jgi:hypothetical protein
MTRILAEPAVETRASTVSGLSVWTCGVLLPIAAILFESLTGFCTNFTDPMPTLWHLVLLITIPICNAMAWWGLKSDSLTLGRRYAGLSGFSAAVALFYTILFIPIAPMAFIGLIVLLPILAFAPALSFLTALRLMRNWKDFVGAKPVALGFGCGLAAIVLLAWPAIGVRVGASLTHSERPWVREFGYSVLRRDGVRQELLAACHAQNAGGAVESVAYISGRGPLERMEAQTLYYRVTGRDFEQEPQDANRGGDRVGAVSQGVRLASSRLDGSLDERSAVGYFEWTMVFRNGSELQQEARTEVALPKGGAVSRATLWIHGSEREAAFGERGRVRQAYESVVRMRRDPLLVTSSGPDRVLVQCFPIEPGGEMKIRIGITAPVLPDGMSDRGAVTLPTLLTQNFDATEPAWLWIESKGGYLERGKLRAGERRAVQFNGMKFGATWASESAGKAVEQRFVERTVLPPRRVVVIVDGSESMRGMRDEIRAALETIPKTVDARVVTVGEWHGGVDAVPALEEALPGTVLWVAGDQPVKFAGTERVRQALERDAHRGRLSVLATGGANVILREVEGLPGVETVPRVGSVGDDLRRFIARWRAPYQERAAERRLVDAGAVGKDAEQGSGHIVRLWAAGQSAAMAIAHQVVTPLTGAVVLETAGQYTGNGLNPASPSSVPTMPEPETYGLIAIGLGVLVALRLRHCYPCEAGIPARSRLLAGWTCWKAGPRPVRAAPQGTSVRSTSGFARLRWRR